MPTAFEAAHDYVETLLCVSARQVEITGDGWKDCFTCLPPFYSAGLCASAPLPPAEIKEKTVYLLQDAFFVCFLFVKSAPGKLALFGPYLSAAPDNALCQRALNENRMGASMAVPLQLFYNSLPVCPHSALITAARIFLSHLYEENEKEYPVREMRVTAHTALPPAPADETPQMKQLEQRYKLENALLLEVENGNAEEAVRLCRKLQTEIGYLKRASDPVRNRKNLSIILNTLLRKSVEHAQVHPFHIDAISANFAHFIEQANTIAQLLELEREMVATYVLLIRRYTLRAYSPNVRKAMNYIVIHLSSELRLADIAAATGVSPSYLSTLFNQETGDSVSAFINQKRVAKAAVLLEKSTSAINDIAFYVGFSDLNYFTRVFRNITGMPPGEYRKKCVCKREAQKVKKQQMPTSQNPEP